MKAGFRDCCAILIMGGGVLAWVGGQVRRADRVSVSRSVVVQGAGGVELQVRVSGRALQILLRGAEGTVLGGIAWTERRCSIALNGPDKALELALGRRPDGKIFDGLMVQRIGEDIAAALGSDAAGSIVEVRQGKARAGLAAAPRLAGMRVNSRDGSMALLRAGKRNELAFYNNKGQELMALGHEGGRQYLASEGAGADTATVRLESSDGTSVLRIGSASNRQNVVMARYGDGVALGVSKSDGSQEWLYGAEGR